MRTHAPLPIGGLSFCHGPVASPLIADECVVSFYSLSRHLPSLHNQHPGKDYCLSREISFESPSTSTPIVANRECWLLTRRRKAGRHARRLAQNVWSPFFPRSVGLRPTDSCANGALFMLPSMLCQSHAIPSISSYSDSPAFQIFSNTPARDHSMKYLWIAVPTPNSDLGKARHWIPVRATKTIASKTFRFGMRLRPAPSDRRYFLLGSRARSGISGSTLDQNSSDTVQDLCRYGGLAASWVRSRRRPLDCVMNRN